MVSAVSKNDRQKLADVQVGNKDGSIRRILKKLLFSAEASFCNRVCSALVFPKRNVIIKLQENRSTIRKESKDHKKIWFWLDAFAALGCR